jgi:hypothetical protein
MPPSHTGGMKHLLRSAVAIAVVTVVLAVLLSHASTAADILGGVIAAIAFVVFIRAIMDLVGQTD